LERKNIEKAGTASAAQQISCESGNIAMTSRVASARAQSETPHTGYPTGTVWMKLLLLLWRTLTPGAVLAG
jgi:hypothetical protein